MRAIAAAVAVLSFAALASPAQARPWTDPNGRLALDLASSWDVEVRNCPDCTYVLAFNPSRDCHVLARPRTGTNVLQPQRVRAIVRDTARITPQIWTSNANTIQSVFPADSAQFVSQTIDSERFWPMQRAELTSADKTVFGAMQLRQGMEIWAFCAVASGTHKASDYDAFFRSIGTPSDAQLQSEVEAAETAAAQQPAAQPAPQPSQDEQKGRRRRND